MKNTGMNMQLGIKWFVFYTKVRPWLAVLASLAVLVDFFQYADVYITNWWLLVGFCGMMAQLVLSIFVWIKSKGNYVDFVNFVKINLAFETVNTAYQQGVQQYVQNDFEFVPAFVIFAVCSVLLYFLWYRLNVKYFERRIIIGAASDVVACSDQVSQSVESKDKVYENEIQQPVDTSSKTVFCEKCGSGESSVDLKNQYTDAKKPKKSRRLKIALWALMLVALVAIIVLIISIACGNGNANESTKSDNTNDTTVPEETKDLAGEDGDTYAEMDYMSEDLGKYVTLGDYKGLQIQAIRPIVSDADINEELQSMIDANTTYEPYDEHVTDRATVAGDYVNIDYVGTMDGEVFEGGSNEGDSVVLAENNGYIDWFEDDLYGIMPGTTVKSTGNFPENYHENFAGKEVTFEITLNYIAGHYTIPELTDAFIKEKTGYETLDEYKEFLRETLQAESDAQYEISKFQTMWQEVIDNTTVIELPESQVMYYYTSQRSAYEAYAAQYGYTYDEFLAEAGVDDSYIVEMMEDRVKEEVVFYSIVKAENIEVTQEDYANGIIQYAADQGMSESALVEQYGEDYIRECILWDKLMVYLASQNTFVEK